MLLEFTSSSACPCSSLLCAPWQYVYNIYIYIYIYTAYIYSIRKKKIYIYMYVLGVSPTKDFHSRIGIFKSCWYKTDSRIICLGAWSKYITKRVKSETVIIIDVNKQGKCVMTVHCCLSCSCCARWRDFTLYYNEALYCSVTQMHLIPDK